MVKTEDLAKSLDEAVTTSAPAEETNTKAFFIGIGDSYHDNAGIERANIYKNKEVEGGTTRKRIGSITADNTAVVELRDGELFKSTPGHFKSKDEAIKAIERMSV